MNNPEEDKYKKFQCKICLDLATEPVITPCGHLYCWQCLYKWAESKTPLKCPYCFNVFELDKVTTIFTGDSKEEKKSDIPKRPTNPRTEPQQQEQQQNRFGNFQFGFGFGFPFMAFSSFNLGQGFQGNNRMAMLFFLGFFVMNFLFPFFNSYLQEVPQTRTSRASRHSQNYELDFMKDMMLILTILGVTEGVRYLIRREARNQ